MGRAHPTFSFSRSSTLPTLATYFFATSVKITGRALKGRTARIPFEQWPDNSEKVKSRKSVTVVAGRVNACKVWDTDITSVVVYPKPTAMTFLGGIGAVVAGSDDTGYVGLRFAHPCQRSEGISF